MPTVLFEGHSWCIKLRENVWETPLTKQLPRQQLLMWRHRVVPPLGNFSRFSWRFKSCDTCLCACAFQQRARDRELPIVSCLGGGVWVAVTRDFERDICVTSEILQSDWTLPNRAPVPRKSTKVPRPSFRVWAGRSGHETS